MTRTNTGLLMKDDLIIDHRLIPYTYIFLNPYSEGTNCLQWIKPATLNPSSCVFNLDVVKRWTIGFLSWSLGHCQCHCHCHWTPEPVTVVWSISVTFPFHVIKHYYQHHSSIHFWLLDCNSWIFIIKNNTFQWLVFRQMRTNHDSLGHDNLGFCQ